MLKIKDMLKYAVPFLLGVFLFALITNYESTKNFIGSILGFLFFISSRFLIGFSIAYILNFFVSWLRRRLHFPFWLAIVTAYLVFLGAIVGLIVYIFPYIVDSVNQIIQLLSSSDSKLHTYLSLDFLSLGPDATASMNSFLENVTDQLSNWASGLLNVSTLLPAVLSAGRTLLNISFGLLVSIYALLQKDMLLTSARRMMYAFMKTDKADRTLKFLRDANQIFSRFIVGKFVDSLIIAAISFVLFTIFGLELTPFLMAITFLFNMIPYFGPIIGSGIIILIMLFFSPLHALYALIITVSVQLLDASYIGPKILGDAVGISPLLTIIAISVGGDIAGIMGIFLGIPILATIKILIFDRYVSNKLAMKHVK